MRRVALAFATLAVLAPAAAGAVDFPSSFTQTPRGAGTERPIQRRGERVREGVEAMVGLGAGFTDTYGFGMTGRVGYTFRPGVYVGGAVDYYMGNSITTPAGSESASASFFGGEVGYKLFPEDHWEIRPYVFSGVGHVRTVQAEPFAAQSVTRFALQPGVLGAYHFGNAFLSAEARTHVMPTPGAFTLLAGAGLAF